MTKTIIGADPPENPDTRDILEKELVTLLTELESQSRDNLEKLLENKKLLKNILTIDLVRWLWHKTKFGYLTNTTKNIFKQLKKN